MPPPDPSSAEFATATFAAGCFWCVEAVFQRIDGVVSVRSGYIGGRTKNPTYRQVTTGETGHAEAVEITYDPSKVDFVDLLKVFFESHDPTQLNRQGNDVGTQYRSAIFAHGPEQKQAAEQAIESLTKAGVYPRPIVTKVEPATTFYVAEDYHQNYFNRNSDEAYCVFVIAPKLKKLDLLKR